MEIRKLEKDEIPELVDQLWKPLAEEMEELTEYNRLAEENVRENTISFRREKFGEEDYQTFILTEDSELAAFTSVEVKEPAPVFARGKKGYIHELYVHEDFRRNGYASTLLEKAQEWSEKHGCESMELAYDAGNKQAEQLYSEEGFEVVRKQLRKEI